MIRLWALLALVLLGDAFKENECLVSLWSHWSACTGVCHRGRSVRTRSVFRPPLISDITTEIAPCPHLYEARSCPKRCDRRTALRDASLPVHEVEKCVVGPWSKWTACDGNCRMAWRTRSRVILHPALPSGNFHPRPCPELYEAQACKIKSNCTEEDRLIFASSPSPGPRKSGPTMEGLPEDLRGIPLVYVPPEAAKSGEASIPLSAGQRVPFPPDLSEVEESVELPDPFPDSTDQPAERFDTTIAPEQTDRPSAPPITESPQVTDLTTKDLTQNTEAQEQFTTTRPHAGLIFNPDEKPLRKATNFGKFLDDFRKNILKRIGTIRRRQPISGSSARIKDLSKAERDRLLTGFLDVLSHETEGLDGSRQNILDLGSAIAGSSGRIKDLSKSERDRLLSEFINALSQERRKPDKSGQQQQPILDLDGALPSFSSCRVGQWQEWSSCKGSCPLSWQLRHRPVVQPLLLRTDRASRGCPSLYEVKLCSLGDCPRGLKIELAELLNDGTLAEVKMDMEDELSERKETVKEAEPIDLTELWKAIGELREVIDESKNSKKDVIHPPQPALNVTGILAELMLLKQNFSQLASTAKDIRRKENNNEVKELQSLVVELKRIINESKGFLDDKKAGFSDEISIENETEMKHQGSGQSLHESEESTETTSATTTTTTMTTAANTTTAPATTTKLTTTTVAATKATTTGVANSTSPVAMPESEGNSSAVVLSKEIAAEFDEIAEQIEAAGDMNEKQVSNYLVRLIGIVDSIKDSNTAAQERSDRIIETLLIKLDANRTESMMSQNSTSKPRLAHSTAFLEHFWVTVAPGNQTGDMHKKMPEFLIADGSQNIMGNSSVSEQFNQSSVVQSQESPIGGPKTTAETTTATPKGSGEAGSGEPGIVDLGIVEEIPEFEFKTVFLIDPVMNRTIESKMRVIPETIFTFFDTVRRRPKKTAAEKTKIREILAKMRGEVKTTTETLFSRTEKITTTMIPSSPSTTTTMKAVTTTSTREATKPTTTTKTTTAATTTEPLKTTTTTTTTTEKMTEGLAAGITTSTTPFIGEKRNEMDLEISRDQMMSKAPPRPADPRPTPMDLMVRRKTMKKAPQPQTQPPPDIFEDMSWFIGRGNVHPDAPEPHRPRVLSRGRPDLKPRFVPATLTLTCDRVPQRTVCPNGMKPQAVIRWYFWANECNTYTYSYCGTDQEMTDGPLRSQAECMESCLPFAR